MSPRRKITNCVSWNLNRIWRNIVVYWKQNTKTVLYLSLLNFKGLTRDNKQNSLFRVKLCPVYIFFTNKCSLWAVLYCSEIKKKRFCFPLMHLTYMNTDHLRRPNDYSWAQTKCAVNLLTGYLTRCPTSVHTADEEVSGGEAMKQ